MATITNTFNTTLFAESPRAIEVILPDNITTEDSALALSTAEDAQSDADDALANVASYAYLQNVLENASTNINTTSTYFLQVGTTATGLYIGNTGIYGRTAGSTTFSIDASGNATFAGALSAATGSFAGSVTIGATIDGGASIGASTGTAMISATSTAQSAAETANTNAGIADGKADDAQVTADTADSKAEAAQSDADDALANVASYSYLESVLENAATNIKTTSTYFLQVGTTATGLYMGSTGLYGRSAGATTFSIDASGNATFAGALSAATGSFAGSVTIGATIDGGASIGSSTGTAMISATSTAQSTAETADSKADVADNKAVIADGKAVTADGKAVAAQADADTADAKAVTADGKAVAAQSAADDAQSDATSALANVASYSYLETVLENAATSIRMDSQYFLIVGSSATGLYMGDTGIYGRNGGSTTFSIDSSGNATFAGSVTADSVIAGGVTIGTSTGTGMISATTTAQTTAETAEAKADVADNKAVAAQGDATTAISDASDAQDTADSAQSDATTAISDASDAQGSADSAQSDATSALNNVASYAYLETVLENASTNIKTTSAYFLQIGNTTTGLYIGNTGIYGKKSGSTTFSIDASGNATFAGALSAATGSFAGSITVGATMDDSVLIGSESGATMQSNTTTAYNRGTLGYTTALGAVSDASEAQGTADAAQADVDSPTHLSTILSSSSASIVANSTAFISIEGTGDAGVFIGSGGIVGKDSSGDDTFSIDASDGSAVFAGRVTTTDSVYATTNSSIYTYAGYFKNNYANQTGARIEGDGVGLIVNSPEYGIMSGSAYGIGKVGISCSGTEKGLWANDASATGVAIYCRGKLDVVDGVYQNGDINADGDIGAVNGTLSGTMTSLHAKIGTADTTTTPSHVFVETGSDGYFRPMTFHNFASKLVDYGTNSNGKYWKFEEGLMICTATWPETTNTSLSNRFGSTAGTTYYGYATRTFPAAFYAVPVVTVSGDRFIAVTAEDITASTVVIAAHRATNGYTQDTSYIAIGRWKT